MMSTISNLLTLEFYNVDKMGMYTTDFEYFLYVLATPGTSRCPYLKTLVNTTIRDVITSKAMIFYSMKNNFIFFYQIIEPKPLYYVSQHYF